MRLRLQDIYIYNALSYACTINMVYTHNYPVLMSPHSCCPWPHITTSTRVKHVYMYVRLAATAWSLDTTQCMLLTLCVANSQFVGRHTESYCEGVNSTHQLYACTLQAVKIHYHDVLWVFHFVYTSPLLQIYDNMRNAFNQMCAQGGFFVD